MFNVIAVKSNDEMSVLKSHFYTVLCEKEISFPAGAIMFGRFATMTNSVLPNLSVADIENAIKINKEVWGKEITFSKYVESNLPDVICINNAAGDEIVSQMMRERGFEKENDAEWHTNQYAHIHPLMHSFNYGVTE